MAATPVAVYGWVRGALRDFYAIGEGKPALGDGLEQICNAGLPSLTECVKLGRSWGVIGAATAALTAVPTTTAGHSLWNGESDTGASYVIDSFGTVEIVVDATQQNQLALFAMMSKGKITAPTDAALTRASMSGKNYSGFAKTAAAVTVVNDGWLPHGPASPGAAAVAGGIFRVTEYNANGLYIVRPGGLFSIAAAKLAATAAQVQYYIRWHEVPLNLA